MSSPAHTNKVIDNPNKRVDNASEFKSIATGDNMDRKELTKIAREMGTPTIISMIKEETQRMRDRNEMVNVADLIDALINKMSDDEEGVKI